MLREHHGSTYRDVPFADWSPWPGRIIDESNAQSGAINGSGAIYGSGAIRDVTTRRDFTSDDVIA